MSDEPEGGYPRWLYTLSDGLMVIQPDELEGGYPRIYTV